MSAVAIIRNTAAGRRVMPIDSGAAELMVERGEAMRHNSSLFEETRPFSEIYQTKVMVADVSARKRSRKESQ